MFGGENGAGCSGASECPVAETPVRVYIKDRLAEKGRSGVYQDDRKRRWAVFAAGLAVAGVGVALTTRAGLGTSPISSVPYVLTFVFR